MTRQSIAADSLGGGQDTIVALATPSGRGAISVVRMSGRQTFSIASQVVNLWPLEARYATLCRISDARHTRMLDQALVTVFPGPDSFTGEDLVEISGHGGHYVPALLMATLISCGARPALPGEFTRRAVLNGKLDITQAEAIGDLVDAGSEVMLRTALSQLDGGLSRRIATLRNSLISVESLIAYDIDFPEEDDGPIARDRVSTEVEFLTMSLDGLLATVPVGEMIREGAVVVIAGRPNVGKSSLFNALLGQSRAIVTDLPGTTRDAIEGFLETADWPIRLVDTAGLREAVDMVEKLGIEVSERYLKRANVILACGDDDESLQAVLGSLAGRTGAPLIRVGTKGDLRIDVNKTANLSKGAKSTDMEISSAFAADVHVSAETGAGLNTLLLAIDAVLSSAAGVAFADMPILTRTRHIHGIKQARLEVAAFGEAWRDRNLPAPVAAVHLRSAALALESLIGAVSTEDVLDRVFSSFCVGK